MNTSTNSLDSKLKKYSMVAGTIMAATAANSQIVYTDVNPDTTVSGSGNSYQLDLNNDATPDLVLQINSFSGSFSGQYGTAWTYTGSGVFIGGGTGSNGWVGTGAPYNQVLALSPGATIDASASTWATGTGTVGYQAYLVPSSMTSYAQTINGNIVDTADVYIGLRFDIGGNMHYGWARIDVNADGSAFTLKDYAYNGTSGGAIDAGQMVGIDEGLSRLVDIRNTPDRVYAYISSDLTNGTLTIRNTMGQTVASEAINGVKAEIGLEGLSTGIYVVTAQFEEGTMTKKIFVR